MHNIIILAVDDDCEQIDTAEQDQIGALPAALGFPRLHETASNLGRRECNPFRHKHGSVAPGGRLSS